MTTKSGVVRNISDREKRASKLRILKSKGVRSVDVHRTLEKLREDIQAANIEARQEYA